MMHRLTILSGIAALVLPLATHAAGTTVQIEQTKTGNAFGTYTLSGPGITKTGNSNGGLYPELPAGEYALSIKPPLGTRAKLTVYRGPSLIAETEDRSYMINIAEGEQIKFSIHYTVLGTVTVESNPEGVSFTLRYPNGTGTNGTTPARFDMLDPGVYAVFYDTKKECEAQKHQERPLDAGGTIAFHAVLSCGDRKIPTQGKTNKPLATGKVAPVPVPVVTPVATAPAVRIVQESSMSETVAGSRVRITLTVRNVTKTTLHDLMIADAFDASLLTPVTPLPKNGEVRSNVLAWFVPELFAGQSWTVTFEMRVSDGAKTGERGTLKAAVSSPDIDAYYSAPVGSTVAIGIAAVPQTGDSMDLALILAGLGGAAILAYFTNRRSGFQVL